MTDWTPEEDEAFNDVERQSNLGKQILREIKPRRKWVGLTSEEISALAWNFKVDSQVIRLVELEIMERNL